MIDFLLWYLALTVIGWLAFPVTFRLLPGLPDRGYTLARTAGLLLWGFVFWLLASFRILQNDAGGVLMALAVLGALAFLAGRGRWAALLSWLREHLRTVLTAELLFLLGFGLLALVRAADPSITGTEKPMELAFINAILRSPAFPPNDPWLSGYAISYYYFGYVIVAMLSRLTGVASGVAFNLAVSSWFALTALGAYGLIYALISAWNRRNPARKPAGASAWALLGPLFVLLVSNLEGFLEMLHARGIFWKQAADGSWQSGFWRWLNIQEICNPPALPLTWLPNRPGGIWWWRASRVLQDFDASQAASVASGQLCVVGREIIDEFPFFSYLLADLHPHVLAMPFALLAIGLALNLYATLRLQKLDGEGLFPWLGGWIGGGRPSFRRLMLFQWVRRPDFWLLAVTLGGLAFLNTWDFPIYVALVAAVFALVRLEQDGWKARRFWDFVDTGLALGVTSILLYLPFYLGFSSQAGGLLPSLSFFTRGVIFWIMFAPLLAPILAWLVWLWRRRSGRSELMAGLKFALVTAGGLWLLSYLVSFAALSLPAIGSFFAGRDGLSELGFKLQSLGGLFIGMQYGANPETVPNPYAVLGSSLGRRLAAPGAWLTLFALLTLTWGSLSSYRRCARAKVEPVATPAVDGPALPAQFSPNAFVLLLVLLGGGLALTPEFFYLRDQFGWRMNTIFKFYFQTWLLWSIAGAYASALLWQALTSVWKQVFRIGLVLLLAGALVYSGFGLRMKFNGLDPANMTLDGVAYMAHSNPDELAAIHYLQQAPLGVVAEAVGGSYSGFARMATHTGQPDVLGWPGHESQWRGGGLEIGSREADIKLLYETPDWQAAREILTQYNIRYVVVGGLERSAYRLSETKFKNFLKPVFQQGNVTLYEAPDFKAPNPAPVEQR